MIDIDHFEKSLQVLQKGGTILFPTDTIWGIGCDATNEIAVDKVYSLKKRDKSKPLIVLASDIEMVKKYVMHVHPKLETLLQYHTRPITVIYDHQDGLPKNVISRDNTIGIRIPQDNFCRELIKSFGKPIVATSANISNEAFPKNFGEITSNVISKVDFTIPYRQNDSNFLPPSAIVRLSPNEELIFLRK
jgi:L-threonylcarbamoyladenylate synthase